MGFFTSSNIAISLTSLALGFLVFFKNKQSTLTLPFIFMSISISLWSLGLAMMVSTVNLELAKFWLNPHYIGCIFIPPTFLHVVLSIFNESIERKKALIISYLSAFMVLILFFLGFVVKQPAPKFDFNFYTVPNFGYFAFVLEFFSIIFYVLYIIIMRIISKTGAEKTRSIYIFIAATIAIIGGCPAFFPVFDIYNRIFLYLNVLIILYPIITTYAIVRHRLMDIEIVIRETAIFAGIFGFSIGLFMLAIAAGEQILQPYMGLNQWVIPAFSLLLVTFAIRPIEKLVYSVVGKYLFRKRFEYQKTLQDAAEGMSKIRDPKKLLSLILHVISAKLKLAGASVLLYDNKQGRYRMKASRGNARDKFINLSPENPLIAWLSEKKTPLTLEEVQKWISDTSGRSAFGVLKSDLVQIQNRMQDLNAAVCVPCFFRDELLGILVLGEKKSGDFFSQEDLNLFSALSDEAAIALKNSQLYFEIDKKANELEALYKREHRLFMHASIAFAAAIDARDPYTHGHSERVTNISLAILDYIGPVNEVDKNPLFRQRLQVAAVLHDVGKIGVPDDILHKPAKLTPKEEKQMQTHPSVGADIVSHIKGLRDLIGGIKYHHERYDGKGYPEGLKSDQIPFMARIISVADTFDAMTSDRPYRKGLDAMVAREEIQKNAAAQFDPYMVAAFLKAFEEGKIR